MADHESEYENFLIENTFILTKYIYAEDFYDYLVSKHVLSSDDKELIDCRHSNPTRRQRAGKLLELLHKKGYEGFRHFMDYLEWEYSHVYEIITKKKARDPPSNYHPQTLEHKRRSRDLWLMDTLTPTMMTEQLQKCFQQNMGLQITLDEFTRVLKIGQDEKKDLEKGMENIRNKFERSEKENADLHRALSSCLKEIDQLKDDKTVLYQDTIQARTECQNYRDRWAQVQMEKDDLIKQLQDAKDTLAEMECAGKSHRISEPGAPKLPPKPSHEVLAKFLKEVKPDKSPNPPNRSETNFQAKLGILENDLEEEKQKNEELMEQCEQLRSDLDEKEKEIRKANKTIARHDQELKNMQTSLDDAKAQKERYYQNILTLEEEKMKLESSRSEEHKKYREEITKTSDLFKANHQLKAELDEYKEKFYRLELKLRSSFRDSGELSQSDLTEAADTFPDVIEDRTHQFVQNIAGGYHGNKFNTLPAILPTDQYKDESMITPNMKTAVITRTYGTENKHHKKNVGPTISTKAIAGSINEKPDPGQRRLHFGSYKRGYDLNHPHLRLHIGDYDEGQSTSSHESSEAEKECPSHVLFAAYKVLFPSYQDSDTGDNAVSVKVRPSALSDIKIIGGNFTGVFVSQAKGIPELKEGDKLKHIIITAEGHSSRERDFEGCTLEEAYKMILQEEHFSEGYSQREVTLTIVRNEKYYRTACQWMTENNKKGDYFFVRCAQTNYGLNKGDILLIRDTRDESKKWRGYSLNKVSGEKVGEERQLMNYRDAQMGIIKQPSSDENKQRKKKAFRTRDFYERVLPMKACHKMPVKLFGHNEILDAILRIMNENSTMFIAKTGEGKKYIDVADIRQDKHIMVSDSEDYTVSTRKIQFINVYIEVDIGERKKAQILGNILDLNLQVGYADISDNASKKEYLTRSGRSYEVLVLSNSSITDKKTLVDALESTVKKAQDQLLWLSENEMDSSEAENYIRFLGHSTNRSLGRISTESQPDCVCTQQESSHPP
ncbi:hypothetical protein ACJMK2_033793 [Sinanodonta woodiana]|uniref:CARD domain-containing protein n=1 Tax=Sinanodonta woodiana TaxID=1069815 RepID=A0ABD3WPH4_SINWO